MPKPCKDAISLTSEQTANQKVFTPATVVISTNSPPSEHQFHGSLQIPGRSLLQLCYWEWNQYVSGTMKQRQTSALSWEMLHVRGFIFDGGDPSEPNFIVSCVVAPERCFVFSLCPGISVKYPSNTRRSSGRPSFLLLLAPLKVLRRSTYPVQPATLFNKSRYRYHTLSC